MKESLKSGKLIVNKVQFFVGLTALLLGSLVYLVDRSPDHTYFVYNSGFNISLYDTLPNIFGAIGNNLPAFIHVFSFILITAGLISCHKTGFLIICLSWFAIDCAFELGQRHSTWASSMIPDWFAHIPFLENTKNYFLLGTFDFIDLAAAAISAAIAYFILIATMKRRQIGL